ncbi:MAG: TolC family protein [Herminiimonas sp.]|nr:TolC family protein [Herminiimonas sp.]
MGLALSGCATFSGDGGFNDVSSMTQQRIGLPVAASTPGNIAATESMVTDLLSKPLTADSAVRVALNNNRGLQAAFSELGVAEADFVQAGRISNPAFHFKRMRGGDDVEIERGIIFSLVGLATMPIRSKIEGGRFEQAKLQAASQAVRLAGDTRRAYFQAVAAQQMLQFSEQVKTSAEAGAELAQRMARIGNFSKLDYAREQAFYADATAQHARAVQGATAAREQLTRLLGLWGPQLAFALPDRLPDLPATLAQTGDVESQAMQQRLDIQIAKRDTAATANALGLTRATSFINVLDAGYVNKSQTGTPRANGYEVSLQLPLFDWGGARTRKGEAQYMAAVHRTADTAVRARSEVRQAYAAYRSNFEIAKHYRDEIVPLRKKIADEVGLRYNGMLASVFELLAEARVQATSVNGAIEAQRDFWLAETDLQAAINGSGDETTQKAAKPSAAAATAGH